MDPFAELEQDAPGDDRSADPFEDLTGTSDADGETFESVDVDEVPIEDVWAAVDETADPLDDDSVAVGGEGGAEAEAVGSGEHRVPKDEYCARCPYLEAPPELACTHDGTTIVAVEDAETFRVRDCPVVESRRPVDDG